MGHLKLHVIDLWIEDPAAAFPAATIAIRLQKKGKTIPHSRVHGSASTANQSTQSDLDWEASMRTGETQTETYCLWKTTRLREHFRLCISMRTRSGDRHGTPKRVRHPVTRTPSVTLLAGNTNRFF
ncbi:hypothetical protein RF55_8728 [Lasius niger]|uniref:Uncharacterized protein n=1 Tax=Lasius niger TaxID=67767 RepID=A0A0J7KM90_LASNI|nr:hypothetical protein RF55_8728 [Lasius niger]